MVNHQGYHPVDMIGNSMLSQRFNKQVIRVLLTGTYESGKTTLAKQLELLTVKDPKSLYAVEIRSDEYCGQRHKCQEIVRRVTSMCDRNELLPENREFVYDLLTVNFGVMTPEYCQKLLNLWNDPAVQNFMRTKPHEAQILYDNAMYHFSIFDRITAPVYIPTEQDYIMTSFNNQGIYRIKDVNDMDSVVLIDVGGGRLNDRKKWISVHGDNKIDIIVFTVAIADYNVETVDTGENRLHDSLSAFSFLLSQPKFKNLPILLIMNQVELFSRKLKERNDLHLTFPEYTKGDDVEAAIEFIKDQFLSLSRSDESMHESHIYCYQMNAIDKESVKQFWRKMVQDLSFC